jgi:hypothetical protein
MARIIFEAVVPPALTPNQSQFGSAVHAHPMAHVIEGEGAADETVDVLSAATTSGGFARLMLVQQQRESVRIHVNPAQVQFVRD